MEAVKAKILGDEWAGASLRAGRAGESPISVMMAQALADPQLISLAPGFVDYETLPVSEVQEAVKALFADEKTARDALQYGTTRGLAPLRELLAERIARMDGFGGDTVRYAPENMIIGTGSQQLLYLLTEALTDPGDIVIVGHPSYFVFMDALRVSGVSCRAVPLDEEGLRADILDDLLKSLEQKGELGRVKLVYTVSEYQNPTGLSLSEKRRKDLYEVVKRASHSHRIHIVEDAAYRELRYDGDDIRSMRSLDEDGETVAYLGSFSKSFSPGVRTGYGLFPKRMAEQMVNLKGAHDFGSASFTQHICWEVMKRGLCDSHAELLRESYRARRDVMISQLDALMPDGVKRTNPHGGLYVWLTLPDGVDTGPKSKLFGACLRHSVLYVPGEFCFAPNSGLEVPTNCIRLSFGVGTLDAIAEGVKRLSDSLCECL